MSCIECRTRTCESNNNQPECAICYETCDFKLKCGHAFHATCIYQWMQINNSCPYCMKPILGIKPKKKEKQPCLILRLIAYFAISVEYLLIKISQVVNNDIANYCMIGILFFCVFV